MLDKFISDTLLRICLAGALAIIVVTSADGGPPPIWNAGQVVKESEAIAIVEGPFVFRGGLRRFNVIHVVHGDMTVGQEIVFYHPSGHMHGYAHIMSGESLLFLKSLDEEQLGVLRNRLPHWAEDLPDHVWTFASDQGTDAAPGGIIPSGYQWMSWIQLKTIRHDGEVDDTPRSILVAQFQRYAGIEPEKEAILTYITGLTALRQAVLADDELPEEEQLDRFQKDIIRSALKEREAADQ